MNQYVRNIVAILLAFLYTSGLMGFHLAKHDCASCQDSTYGVFLFSSEISELFCGDEEVNYSDISSMKCKSSCCSTHVSQYKIAPETPQSGQLKLPVVSELVLFTHIYFTSLLTEEKEFFGFRNLELPPDLLRQSPDELCCFLC
ncbi:hypothetical protein EMN47_07185 [Prolixibacteraceae bacterium JC049]|nr:hypothetical protein [Prolixibacteraceae bacterium JC049]